MKTIVTLDLADQPYGFPQLDGSGSLQATGSLYGTASWAINVSGSISNAITAETASFVTSSNVWGPYGADSIVSSSYALTASYAMNGGGGGSTDTGSLLTTASVSSNIITFTKGNGNTFPITVDTGSATIATQGSTIYSKNPSTSNFNTSNGVFIGNGAGLGSTSANDSIFVGYNSGYIATFANSSIFMGREAGFQATNAYGSVFIGNSAGGQAESASYSVLIGYNAGYRHYGPPSIGSNNIIIGTNVTLPDGTKDSINLGGIIFATGSYSNPNYNFTLSGSAGGRVGINKVSPTYTLDVSGSGNFSNGLTVTGSLIATVVSASNASSGSNFVVTSTLTIDESLIDFSKYASTIVGSNNMFQQATGSWTSAHCKYTVYKGANSRAGEFITSWNGTTVSYYDNATVDIGSTSDITFSSAIVSSQLQINAVAASSAWTVKMLVTYL